MLVIEMVKGFLSLKRFAVPGFLFFQEYRLRFSRFFKYGVIMALISAYFSVVVSFPLVLEFGEIGPYQAANFDVFFSGPLEKSEIEKIENKAETIVKGADFGGVEAYVKDKFAGRIDLFAVDNLQKALEISQINERYIRRGEMSKRGAAIDEYSARKLGIELGDQISIKIRDITVDYRIVAILYATSATKGTILADYPQKLREAFRPYEYSSFWIKWKNGGEIELSYAPLERVEYIKSQQEAQDEFMHNRMFKLLKYGSIVILLLIALKDMLSLLETRKKDYALLLGLGASRRSLAVNFLIENVLRMIIIVIVGILCAKLYIQMAVGLYYPTEAFIASIIGLILASIMASILGSTVIFKRLKKIPIAHVLAEG